jgi:hypothetical protein
MHNQNAWFHLCRLALFCVQIASSAAKADPQGVVEGALNFRDGIQMLDENNSAATRWVGNAMGLVLFLTYVPYCFPN